MIQGNEQESLHPLKDAFLLSRNGAILRCAEIMVDSGRKDLAKQILVTTRIDQKKLKELRTQLT